MFCRSLWRWLPDVSAVCAAAALCAVIIGLADEAAGVEPTTVEISTPLPYGPAPINYFSETDDDLVKRLQVRLDDGSLKLTSQPGSGYLLDLLRVLQVPMESQVLVFSKTSLNQSLIRPTTPRAIYFNDDVTVGWVHDSAAIEIAIQNPDKGTLFYTLPQPAAADTIGDEANPPTLRFRRDGRCTACHISARTLHVPGHIVSSYLTDTTGAPREGYSTINHTTPFPHRWGGWYATGQTPGLVHWGNLIGEKEAARHKIEPAFRGTSNAIDSAVDLTRYPSRHSDVVALLVLNHQLHFYNLVNRVSFEFRLNRRSDAEEQLIRYALMQDEAPLVEPVTGSTKFAEVYQQSGPDGAVRELRKLDLKARTFQHALSPLIASRSFQSLPEPVKTRLYEQLDTELARRPDRSAHELLRKLRE